MTATTISDAKELAAGGGPRAVLREMIAAARLAPSAENTQPWRFAWTDDALIVGLDAADWLPSDVDGLLVLASVGAAVENAIVAARQRGCELAVRSQVDGPLPRFDGVRPVAAISLDDADHCGPDPLYPFIAQRQTVRRLEPNPIEAATLERISASISAFHDVRVDWFTKPADLRAVGRLIGLGNRLRFEFQPYQQEFYDHLRFTPQDARRTADGLDVATLALPASARVALGCLRPWNRMRLANALGFSRAVARQAAEEVRASSAVGVLSIGAPTVAAMLNGGRAFERLWLATTAAEWALHPTASLPAFLAHARRGSSPALPARLQALAAGMAEEFAALAPQLTGRIVQMAFRIGRPRATAASTVRSLRRPAGDLTFSCDFPAAHGGGKPTHQ